MNDEYDNYANGEEDVYVAEPDEGFYEDDMLDDLPGWPKPVGILSIVFGGIAVTCMGVSLAFMGFGAQMMSGQLGDDPVPPSMQLNLGMMVQGVSVVLLNVLLIIGGITCLSRKYATRPIHLVYAVLLIVMSVVGVFFQLQILSAMDQYVIDYPDNAVSQSYSRTVAMIQGMIGIAIGLAWPIFCLIWFGLVKKTEDDLTGGVMEAAA